MMTLTKILAGTAGLAALAVAAPAAAQYYGASPYAPYGNAYGYNNAYGNNAYGYNANSTAMATQQCNAAVQSRLNTRGGLSGILGAVLGARSTGGRVVQVTRVTPTRSGVTVRGLASSGAGYARSPYGAGAYGAYGYNYAPDLSFKCTVDYRGYVRGVNINRR
jgi:hypothetical protein